MHVIVSFFTPTVVYWLEVILAVTIAMVGLHEVGHWATGQYFGMHTPVYSIGFGPRQISFLFFGRRITFKTSIKLFTWHNTEFRLSPIPLGGYALIPELSGSQSGRKYIESLGLTYRQFPYWQRFVVMAAGVAVNVVVALTCLTAYRYEVGKPYMTLDYSVVYSIQDQSLTTLQAGDRIESVGGVSVIQPQQVFQLLANRAGKPIAIALWRQDKHLNTTVTPAKGGYIGATLAGMDVLHYQRFTLAGSFIDAVSTARNDTVGMARGLGMMLHIIPKPSDVPAEALQVRSMISVLQIGKSAAQQGFWQLLNFVYFLSIYLAFFNVLPLPVLDGGAVIFLFVEKLRGKPVPDRVRMVIAFTTIGALFLLTLVGVYNDIVHPVLH